MNFSYDRINSTPNKRNQNAISKISKSIDRRLMSKVLDFLNRI